MGCRDTSGGRVGCGRCRYYWQLGLLVKSSFISCFLCPTCDRLCAAHLSRRIARIRVFPSSSSPPCRSVSLRGPASRPAALCLPPGSLRFPSLSDPSSAHSAPRPHATRRLVLSQHAVFAPSFRPPLATRPALTPHLPPPTCLRHCQLRIVRDPPHATHMTLTGLLPSQGTLLESSLLVWTPPSSPETELSAWVNCVTATTFAATRWPRGCLYN